MTEDITFRRNGAIMRGSYRVGWIEDRRDTCGQWFFRLTPASGRPGVSGYSDRIAEAKIRAMEALRDV